MCSAHTDGPVALANAFLVAADPPGRTGRPGGVTRRTLLGWTLQAVAEHLCWYAADVPALQIPRETALHRIYLPIYKTDREGNKRERAENREGKDEGEDSGKKQTGRDRGGLRGMEVIIFLDVSAQHTSILTERRLIATIRQL